MPTYYLQKTLTKTGNTLGFAGADIQFNFDPTLSKVIENINKKYAAKTDIARDKPSYPNYPSKTLLLDVKTMEWIWTITGVLTNDSGTMTAAKYNGNVTQNDLAINDTAINKKNLLIAFAEQGGNMKWCHRNFGETRPTPPDGYDPATTYEPVNIISMQFEDIETEVTSSTAEDLMKLSEQRISFIIVLQRGQDR